MAKYSSTIEYNIKTSLEKSGLTQLQTELQKAGDELRKLRDRPLIDSRQVENARLQLDALSTALSNSFNASLGMLDLSHLNAELKSSGIEVKSLSDAFKLSGVQGTAAMGDLVKQLIHVDSNLKRTSTLADKIFTTLGNTVRWGIISRGFNAITDSARQSIEYMKELDDSLTQIMLVTDYNRDAMNQYAKSANEAAKAVGQTTVGMTNASLIFAQQGYDLSQSQDLATLSAKLANASQQDTAATSDQITALMNAYGLDDNIQALSQALDDWALIANVSAADVKELAEASQRAASMADAVGVSSEQLSAQIATIESVTREAPEQIGNGLKTLYARFSDLALGETLEDGVDLGKVTGVLNDIGVQVLDQMGNMRDVGSIIEDLMVVWQDLDDTARVAAAQALAGKYQVNRFEALMNNADMYEEYLGATGEAAAGTLDQMNQKYLDSWEGRMKQLQASLEGLFNDVFDPDNFYPAIDAVKGIVDALDTMIQSVGGGKTALLGLGAVLTQVLSQNLARTLNTFTVNKEIEAQRRRNAEELSKTLELTGLNRSEEFGSAMQQYQSHLGDMDENQYKNMSQYMTSYADAVTQASIAQEKLEQNIKATQEAFAFFTNRPEEEFVFLSDDDQLANLENAKTLLSGLSQKDLREFDTRLQTVRTSLTDSSQAVQELSQNLDLWGEDLLNDQVLLNDIQYVKESFIDLNNEGILTTQQFARVTEIFDALSIEVEEQSVDVKDYRSELAKLLQIVMQLQDKYKKMSSESLTNIDYLFPESQKVKNLQNQATNREKNVQGQFNVLSTQQRTQEIIQFAGAVGQLTFAWQSFQSLGSLWANEDVDAGEGIVKTIMNLSMTLPSLIKSYQNITKIIGINSLSDTFTNLSTARNQVKQTAEQVAQASTLVQQAHDKERAAAQRVTTITKKYGEAHKSLPGMKKMLANAAEVSAAAETKETAATEKNTLAKQKAKMATVELAKSLASLAITSAIMIAAAAWSYYSQKVQEAMQKEKEAFEQASQTAQDTETQITQWTNLYRQYKDTGQVSDELISSSKELASALGIVGGQAIVAAGQFDQLKSSVDKVAQADYQKAIDAANLLLTSGETGRSLRGDSILNGSVFEDLNHAYRMATHSIIAQVGEVQDASQEMVSNIISQYAPQKDASTIENITRMNQALKELKNTRAEYDALLKQSPDDNKLQNIVAALDQAIEKIGDGLSIEDIQTANTAIESIITNGTKLDEFNNKLREAGTDSQKIIDVFTSDSNLKDYFAGLVDEASQLEFILNNISDISQQLPIAEELFTVNAEHISQDQILSFMEQQGYASLYDPFEQTDIVRQVFDQLKDKIANSGLSDEAKTSLLSGIDWSKPIDEIIIEAENALQKQVERAQTHPFEDSEPIDSDVDTEEFQNLAQYIYNAAGKLEDFDAALKENDEDVKEVTESILRYDHALEEAFDKMEDWERMLQSSAIEDQAKAAAELGNVYKDLLNISDDIDLSPDFTNSIDNLELLKRAIEGDVDAYNQLQIAAMEDIIYLKVGLDDSKFKIALEDLDTIKATLYDENGEWASLPIGAELNDENFIEALNKLIEDCDLTADEAEKALAAMGIDAELEEQTDTVPNTSTYSVAEPYQISPFTMYGTLPTGLSENGTIKTEKTKITIPRFGMRTRQIPVQGQTEASAIALNVTGNKTGESSGGKVTVKSVKKGAGGGAKYNNSSYGGGASHPTSSGGSGGSGGGGGGSGSSYTPKTQDPIEEEIDLYEEVNTKLADVQAELEGIEREEDRLYGDKARANIEKRLTLLDKEIQLNQQKLEIQQKERADIRSQLSSQFGVQFDSEGFITNYASVLKNLEGNVNNLINQFNATGDEAGQDALANQIDSAKDSLDKYKKLQERYDKLQSDEIRNTLNQIEQLKDASTDLRIEVYKTSQEAIDDLKELNSQASKLSGFLTGYKTDSPFRTMVEDAEELAGMMNLNKGEIADYYDTLIEKRKQAMALTTDENEKSAIQASIDLYEAQKERALTNPVTGTGYLDLAYQDLERLQNWWATRQEGRIAEDDIFGDNEAALLEAYEDAYSRTLDYLLEYEKKVEDLEKDIIEGYDDINDRLEEQVEQYDRLTDRLERLADVDTLINGEKNFATLEQINNERARVLTEQAKLANEVYLYWVEQYNKIEDKNSDIAKDIREKMLDALDEVEEKQKEAAEAFKEAYENAIAEAFAQLDESVFGTRYTDITQLDWEHDKQFMEDYADEYQKTMKIEQMRLKFMDLLDANQTASLATQRKIKATMDEVLGNMEKDVYLSEYDVKLANARLEVLQKQIALEDARANKNQMKLRRDTQGNYRYVYAADQGDIRSAQEDLISSQLDLWDTSVAARRNATDQLIAIEQSYRERLQAIADAEGMDEDEREAAAKEALADYQRDLEAIGEEYKATQEGMRIALEWAASSGIQTIQNMAEEISKAIADGNNETLKKLGLDWDETLEAGLKDIDRLKTAGEKAYKDMGAAATKWRTILIGDENGKGGIGDLVGHTFGDVDTVLNETKVATDDLADATENLFSIIDRDTGKIDKMRAELQGYKEDMENLRLTNNSLVNSLQKANADLDKANAESLNWKTKYETAIAPKSATSGSGSGNGGSSSKGPSLNSGSIIGFHGRYYENSWGQGNSGNLHSEKAGVVRISSYSGTPYGSQSYHGAYAIHIEELNGGPLGWIKPEQAFKSGGYTGQWSGADTEANGKLAMLHQKELVLNATDTQNILNAVDVVRGIVDTLKSAGTSALSSLGYGASQNNISGETISQRVEITAEFPNVHTADDIKTALLSLSDNAVQYAFREK